MKKCSLFFLLVAGILISAPNQAQGITLGQAEMNFNFEIAPDSIRYNYSGNYVGRMSYRDTVNNVTLYPWDPQGRVYLDSTYQVSRGDGQSNVAATWDPQTGNSTFDLVAVSRDPGNEETTVDVNVYATMVFEDLVTFPSFSYDFDFLGQRDSNQSSYSFVIQMEIGYGQTIVYSDYRSTVPGYRDNIVIYNVWNTQPVNGIIDVDGSRVFSAYTAPTAVDWWIRYDFMGAARDSSGSDEPPSEIPEPMTLVLLGSGLGLAFFRKKS